MATRSLGQLTIDLIAKIAGFEQGMDRAARTADKRTRDIERSFKRVSAFGGTLFGGALVGGVSLFIKNTIEAEKQLAQLDAILKSTGNAAGYSRDQLLSMAQELQKVSTFSSSEIVEAQTRLLSYSGIVGENIPRAMQAVIDQSARLGMSLTQSAETIGRALESPAKAAAALAQQGFGAAFTKEVRATINALVEAGREADAQILILEILEESYGGAAEAARNTLGGALQALKNTFNDVLTGDEGSFADLTKAVNDLNDALNDPGFRAAVSTIGKAFIDLATEVAKSIDPMIREVKGVGLALEGLAGQAKASAQIIAGAFSLSMDKINQGLAAYREASLKVEQGLQGALGGLAPNPFWNVRGGVTSTYDRPRTVDTTGLVLKDAEKKASSARSEVDKLRLAYDHLMESMHRRIELFGKEGEVARVRYEIEHGSLKGISAELAEQAIQRAKQIDQMEQLQTLQEAADEAAKRETKRIQDALKAGKDLLDELEFELALMRMTNAERATAIQLRGLDAEAVKKYGDAIARANRDIEESMKQVRLMDDMRNEFGNFFEDIISGAESVGDAFKNLINGIADSITRFVSQRLVEQLFGGFGTLQGGSTGWLSTIAGLFGGRRASGGWTSPNTMYEVNERGIEMATVRGRDYLLTGNSPVEITPNHRLGFGGAPVVNNFAFAAPTSPKTQSQIAARVGYEIRRAQRLGI